jgi:hypothetical protein
MIKSSFISIAIIYILMVSCCSTDHGPPTDTQYVVIKNYGGFNLTNAKDNLLFTNQYGYKFGISPAQTIIDNGDTLCVISPYYSLFGGEFNASSKGLLVNKILNRTDTLNVKFSLKKVDSCNEYPVMDEATLNGKKGVFRTVNGLYGNVIELKFK